VRAVQIYVDASVIATKRRYKEIHSGVDPGLHLASLENDSSVNPFGVLTSSIFVGPPASPTSSKFDSNLRRDKSVLTDQEKAGVDHSRLA
jgi:hypothetical protein